MHTISFSAEKGLTRVKIHGVGGKVDFYALLNKFELAQLCELFMFAAEEGLDYYDAMSDEAP